MVALLPKGAVFGSGVRGRLLEEIAAKKVIIVCSPRGKNQFLSDSMLKEATKASKSCEFLEVAHPNPSLDSIQALGDQGAALSADLLIGFGGGSAIDFAKSLSAIDPTSKNQASLLRLIQLQPEIRRVVPVIAVPTTSGTGAEVTSFATVWDHATQRKLSLSHPNLKPSLALVDPELAYSVPSPVALETGLDALNQAFESIWNKNKTTESFRYASNAIALILPSLSAAINSGGAPQSRINLSLGSTLAGLAINSTKTSICHSISYPLTARFGVPHGLACAFSMTAVMKIVYDSQPDILGELAEAIGFPNVESLTSEIDSLITVNKVREKVQARVGDLSTLPRLVSEMYTPGRSDNFITAIDDDLLTKVLIESSSP